MTGNVDWKHGEDHMWSQHQVTVAEANEALDDTDALVFDPDPKSKSGISVRVIGYVHNEDHTGFYGANGWKANSTERRIYQEGVDEND